MTTVLKLPKKQSLAHQTAEVLREQIAERTWTEWLPGERALCDQLQVSRHTLRDALRQLQASGEIVVCPGLGNRVGTVKAKPSRRTPDLPEIGLLIGGELDMLLPSQINWIDQLRGMLAERGSRLHLFHGRKFAQRRPARALRDLVTRHSHRCWVLLFSTAGIQQWFQDNREPAIVAGSLYPGISLPYCDLDHHAVGRHAAGIFLGRGHRQLALLVQRSQKAGDLESELGFTEAARQGHAQVAVGYHDATAETIAAAVKRLMARSPAPTAMLVVNAFHFLGALSSLARLGYRVPENLSLISRDGESYLAYLLPTPAHYRTAPKTFAKTLLIQVLQLLEAGLVTKRAARIMPEFHSGQSLRAFDRPAERTS